MPVDVEDGEVLGVYWPFFSLNFSPLGTRGNGLALGLAERIRFVQRIWWCGCPPFLYLILISSMLSSETLDPTQSLWSLGVRKGDTLKLKREVRQPPEIPPASEANLGLNDVLVEDKKKEKKAEAKEEDEEENMGFGLFNGYDDSAAAAAPAPKAEARRRSLLTKAERPEEDEEDMGFGLFDGDGGGGGGGYGSAAAPAPKKPEAKKAAPMPEEESEDLGYSLFDADDDGASATTSASTGAFAASVQRSASPPPATRAPHGTSAGRGRGGRVSRCVRALLLFSAFLLECDYSCLAFCEFLFFLHIVDVSACFAFYIQWSIRQCGLEPGSATALRRPHACRGQSGRAGLQRRCRLLSLSRCSPQACLGRSNHRLYYGSSSRPSFSHCRCFCSYLS